jgi:tetratricopeptide (TPR) repeat protein
MLQLLAQRHCQATQRHCQVLRTLTGLDLRRLTGLTAAAETTATNTTIFAGIKILSITFLFTIILNYNLSGQADSLKYLLNKTSGNKDKAIIYNKLSDFYLDFNETQSRAYADSARIIGLSISNYEIISDSYVNYANSYFFRGNLDSAYLYLELSYYYIKKSGNKNEIAAALNRLGLIYESKSKFDIATEYYYKALKIYESTSYLKGQAEILNNLGAISEAIGNTEVALSQYQKSLELFERSKVKEAQANVYNNIANLYAAKNINDSAIYFINKSIDILIKNNRLFEAATAYFNASYFYEISLNSIRSKECMDSALLLYQQTDNIHGIASVYEEQAENLFHNYKYEEAIGLFNKSLELRKKVGNLHAEAETLKKLSKFYEEMGDYQHSLQYYREHIILRDSIFDGNTQKTISELNVKYQTEKKDKEILILKKENEIKRNYYNFLILIITALLGISILLFYFFRTKTKLLRSQKSYYEQQEKLSKLEIEKQETNRIILEKEVKAQQQINEIQKSKFEAELDHSKRELITTTMQVLNKNKTLTEIQDYLESLTPKSIEEKKVYRELLKMVKENINLDTDWEQLKIHFDKVNTGFFEKLQSDYPELSQGDLKVLAYIKIKLSSKEIAQMMNISPAGINKRLYRIRRKMNLPSHANISEYLDII